MASQSSDVSLNEPDECLSFLDMELEALQSIFINELEVKEDKEFTTVSIDLNPSTADKLDEQYVRVTLQFILNEEYPEKIPEIRIRNPRGLSDEKLNSITQDLLKIAESKKGSSMLFEMIDAAKEHLTDGNRPSGECAICLHGFSDNDAFTKTECYHYFHSHCLARYAKNFFEISNISEDDAENKSKNNELLCPMCRIPIEFNEWDADYPPPEESYESNFTLSEEMVELQRKMAVLFQKQVQKGGIIDVEAEKNKYLLEISNVPTRLNPEEMLEQKPPAEGDSVAENKCEESNDISSPDRSDRKEYVRDHNRKTDHRARNRNFNRPNESRGNNRYDYRYNKQSYNQGNYNRYRYGKQNFENSYQDEPERTKDSSKRRDLMKNEDATNSSPDIVDDASETSEYPSPKARGKYNPNYSPRYNNRGYRHGRNNYNNYDGNRRSDKSGYHDRGRSQTSHRYNAQRTDESSCSKFEDDFSSHDGNNHKSDYRYGNYKRDNDYYSKQRYSDNRNNFHSGFKGAYSGGKDAYNSRSNRYRDSNDREQYSERNYREKKTYRDAKYKNNSDNTYNRFRQGTRNYSGSRPERYSDRSYAKSSNNESESLESTNQNENGDHDTLAAENGSIGNSNFDHDSSQREESLDKKVFADSEEKSSNTVDSSSSSVLPIAFGENSDVTPRTVNPPPGFANPLKKVVYGLQGANPPPGFNRS